jgi:pimeloyl-ACP methyl ester carboxylesterase
LWFAASLLALVLVYIGVSWVILSVLITPGRKPHAQSPAELGFADVHELAFRSRTGDVPLRGWLVPGAGRSAVILIHGLHSHAWDCQTPDLARAYARAGFHVLLFDLRGHGASGGEHIGLGLLERGDVQAAVDILLQEGIEPGRIGLHGTSYGAAVALLAAAQIQAVGAVLADSSFSSVRDALGAELARRTGLPAAWAAVLRPGLRLLTWLIYKIEVDDAAPVQAVKQIAPRPLLLVHGTEDPLIPYEQAERLKAAAGSSARLWPLRGAAHTQGVRLVPHCARPAPTRDLFLRRAVAFFERHLGADRPRPTNGPSGVDPKEPPVTWAGPKLNAPEPLFLLPSSAIVPANRWRAFEPVPKR